MREPPSFCGLDFLKEKKSTTGHISFKFVMKKEISQINNWI